MLRYVILILCVVVEMCFAQRAPAELAFYVGADDTSVEQLVALRSSNGKEVTCRLAYSTGIHKPEPPPVPQEGTLVAPEEIVSKLQSGCYSLSNDFYKYTACLGDKTSQTNSVTNNDCGKFKGLTEDKLGQQYTDGTPCDGGAGRRSVVEFTCAQAAKLLEVEEVGTCSYVFTMGVPEVCNHPSFKAKRVRRAVSPGSTRQQWFMEIAENDNGDVQCTALLVESGKEARFSDVSLQLSGAGVKTLQSHVARGPDRTLLLANEFQAKGDVVTTTADFNGRMEFIEVVARPDA